MGKVHSTLLLVLSATVGCSSNRFGFADDLPPPNPPGLTSSSESRGSDPDKKPPYAQKEQVLPAAAGDRTGPGPTERDAGLPAPEGIITARVAARVNGQPILLEEVRNAAWFRLQAAREKVPPNQWSAVESRIIQSTLEDIIERELIIQEALARVQPKFLDKLKEAAGKEFESALQKQKEQLKIKSDDELRLMLEKEGRSLEEMRRQSERLFIAQEYLRSRIKPKVEEISRGQLLEFYQENIKEYEKPERVVWQHIFIDVDRFPDAQAARRQAEQVLAHVQKIRSAEQFAPLAEKYSNGSSQYRKGEGEGNERGRIRPEDVEDLVFRLPAGQVGPLVETPRGFHIVRVVQHEQAGRMPFDKACPDIRKKLQAKIWQAEYGAYIKELRSKAYVEQLTANNP